VDIDLRVFSYLDGERWDFASAPGIFIVNGKTKALIKRYEPFGVRRGYGNVVNTDGWHQGSPSIASRCADVGLRTLDTFYHV
jgi:hypothetical protein